VRIGYGSHGLLPWLVKTGLKTYEFAFWHYKERFMWYFAWILGVLLACAFGIINVMWMETEEMLGAEKDKYVSLKD